MDKNMMSNEKFNYEESLDIVKKYIEEKGCPIRYTTYPANECVGVSYGNVEAYYIVRDGKVVDIQID